MKSEKDKTEESPLKTAAEELAFLRKVFRDTVHNYSTEVESQIIHMREAVLAEARGKKVKARQVRDARGMVDVIRTLQIKPEKGRRRDLKKVDALLAELRRRIENW